MESKSRIFPPSLSCPPFLLNNPTRRLKVEAPGGYLFPPTQVGVGVGDREHVGPAQDHVLRGELQARGSAFSLRQHESQQ